MNAFRVSGYVMGSMIVQMVMMSSQSSAVSNVKTVNSQVQTEYAFQNFRNIMVSSIVPVNFDSLKHYFLYLICLLIVSFLAQIKEEKAMEDLSSH